MSTNLVICIRLPGISAPDKHTALEQAAAMLQGWNIPKGSSITFRDGNTGDLMEVWEGE